MIEFVFYMCGVAFIMYEWVCTVSPKDIYESNRKYMDESRKPADRRCEDFDAMTTRKTIVLMFSIIWLFGGIFTDEWAVFILMLALNMLNGKLLLTPLRKRGNAKGYAVSLSIASLVTASLSMFAIINQYHLHIDINKIILGWAGL